MPSTSSNAAALAGRFLLALMFILAGYSKISGFGGTVGYIASKGLPLPHLLAIGTIVLELVAGVALLVGYRARRAAALAAFTVLATLLFHSFWAMPSEQQQVQQLMFVKNLAITGGLLMVVVLGAGGWRLDARRRG